MKPTKATTITDVARTAGVSTATVSRALSNPNLVSESAREAVASAVKSTGYRVNQAARNLRLKRAGAVFVLVPNLGNPFYSAILSGISDGFAKSGYSVLISDTESQPLGEDELAGNFLDGRIDGVLCLDGNLPASVLESCHAAGVSQRIVFVCEWTADQRFHSIRSDNVDGAKQAIRHLYELGHRRIASVTGPEGNVLTAARRTGVRAEREKFDLLAPDAWIIRSDFSLESGRDAAERILEMKERPTAIFCAADTVAFGLIARLQEGGLSVPGDISVVGFDDIEMSGSFIPALSTIRQDRQKIGKLAAKRLLQRMADPTLENGVELVEVDLVKRTSTAPPKS